MNVVTQSKSIMTTRAVYADPDCLYSWSARDSHGRGSCGVTDEPDRVEAHLREALTALALDARGQVEIVRLDRSARQPCYIHGAVVIRLQRGRADHCRGRVL
jgi:hypothetical protein